MLGFDSFYNATMWPLLVVTLVMALLAKPKASEEKPAGFQRYRFIYIAVWTLCIAGDWFQGPFIVDHYYGWKYNTNQLMVVGFASSGIFGCFVGGLVDSFGRKRSCIMYCILYMLSCLLIHFNSFWLLFLGRVLGGISTSLLFSCFECWMVSEHFHRGFSGSLLGYMFGLMFSVMYVVGIVTGLVSNFVVKDIYEGLPEAERAPRPIYEGSMIHVGGTCNAFDCAIVCMAFGMVMIMVFFEENYGTKADQAEGEAAGGSSLYDNLCRALSLLARDSRTSLLMVVVSVFEASMFIFVAAWWRSLSSREPPLDAGKVFAMFMMACMCGASASTLSGGSVKPATRLLFCFLVGTLAFALCASWVTAADEQHLPTGIMFAAFLAFEFCVGMYFPSVGVLKSDIVPEDVRGTMYNLYRLPLNIIVVAVLLCDMSLLATYMLLAVLMLGGLFSVVLIRRIEGRSVKGGGALGTELAAA